MAGGDSGELFSARVAAGGRDGLPVVLRVHGAGARRRGPEAAGLEAAVLTLAHGLVPVPEVVEVRPGLLVMSRLPGERLDRVLAEADTAEDEDLVRQLGAGVGELLGRLSGIAIRGAGVFLDDRLTLGPVHEGAESLVTWLDRHRTGTALAGLPARHLDGLRAVCRRADSLLATSHRACLVHGDLSVQNLLADPSSGRITGLIDWEFAHPGHPAEDLGKLLRATPGSAFLTSVIEAMTPWLPTAEQAPVDQLRERARAADLYWIIEAASRRGSGPATDRAHALLAAIAEHGVLLPDLNA